MHRLHDNVHGHLDLRLHRVQWLHLLGRDVRRWLPHLCGGGLAHMHGLLDDVHGCLDLRLHRVRWLHVLGRDVRRWLPHLRAGGHAHVHGLLKRERRRLVRRDGRVRHRSLRRR